MEHRTCSRKTFSCRWRDCTSTISTGAVRQTASALRSLLTAQPLCRKRWALGPSSNPRSRSISLVVRDGGMRRRRPALQQRHGCVGRCRRQHTCPWMRRSSMATPRHCCTAAYRAAARGRRCGTSRSFTAQTWRLHVSSEWACGVCMPAMCLSTLALCLHPCR